jgi:G:T-mismatch repair DNA endonuclease (very short patch repair protein)
VDLTEWAPLFALLTGYQLPEPELGVTVAGEPVTVGWSDVHVGIAVGTPDRRTVDGWSTQGWEIIVVDRAALTAASGLHSRLTETKATYLNRGGQPGCWVPPVTGSDQLVTADGWAALLRTVAGLEFPAPEFGVTVAGEPVTVGWSDVHVGIAVGTPDQALHTRWETDGWSVTPLHHRAVMAAAPLAAAVASALVAWTVATSRASATLTVSRAEDTVLAALIAAGTPVPDRNFELPYRRGDGVDTYTCPDMVWADRRIIVEVDGVFPHGGADDDKAIRLAAENPEAKRLVRKGRRVANERDAAKRTALTAAGFQVFVITDTQANNRSELAAFVATVVAALNRAAK